MYGVKLRTKTLNPKPRLGFRGRIFKLLLWVFGKSRETLNQGLA